MKTGNQLLVIVAVIAPDIIRNIFCTIFDMKTTVMIKKWRYTVVLSECYH